MSLILISQAFPYALIVISSLALIFHPIQSARAFLFFTFGYFLTTAIYSLGFAASYDTRYHPLIIASAITILLYHSLDVTWGILCAWIIELLLIVLNILMVWDAGIPPSLHWQATIVLNAAEFLILIGNWGYGNTVLYSRFFDLDLPLRITGHRYRVARAESARLEEAKIQ
mgnify:CR=1 FL=1